MKKSNNYNVLQLINKYSKYLGTNVENMLLGCASKEDEEYINDLVEKNIRATGLEECDKNLRLAAICNVIAKIPEMNNDNDWKLRIASNIYRSFSKFMQPKELADLKNIILQDKDYIVIKFSTKYNNKQMTDYEIITKENKKKISSIKSDTTRQLLEESLQIADILDLANIVDSKISEGAFFAIINKVANEIFINKDISEKELKQVTEYEKFDEVVERHEDKFKNYIVNYLKDNLQYVDTTDLLLNSSARIMLGIKLEKKDEIEGITLSEKDSGKLKLTIEYLNNIYKELQKNLYKDKSYSIFLDDGSEVISANKANIKEFLDRCTKDDYVSDKDIEDIHKLILNGDLIEDTQKRRIANVNLQDLIELSKSYKETEDNEVKEKMKKCGEQLIEYLKDEKIIEDEGLLNLYIDGELDLDIIKDGATKEFSEEYYNNKFKRLYDMMIYSINPGEQLQNSEIDEAKRLVRFSDLYKNLIEEEKVDIDSLIERLITAYGEEAGHDIMGDLYDLKLVEIEKCIDWTGAEFLISQYKNGKLQPAKVRDMYCAEIINIDDIANIMNAIPDMSERFMTIGAIFPEETEENINMREILIDKCISIDSGAYNKTGNKRGDKIDDVKVIIKHVTDPFSRMNLIKSLDKEYSFEMSQDGHGIFKLPNLDKVIIEKLLDKNKEFSYGSATYILDRKYYEKEKDNIVKEGKICRSELFKDKNNDKVTRKIHSVEYWGKSIKEYFGIEENSAWSKEDIEEIDKIINEIKESEKLIK